MNKDNNIVNAFRRWGYLQADLDIFGRLPPFPHPDLDNVKAEEAKKWREIYCGHIGTEFMHMPIPERCAWVAKQLEDNAPSVDKMRIFQRILSAELFEDFVHKRYIGAKRFSLEGIAAVIPLLDTVLDRAVDSGFEVVMMSMAHRGRLTIIVHTIGVPASKTFACFEDVDPRSVLGGGDVKYHRGATGNYQSPSGKTARLHLASNPSHLEAINPVILGRTRARQERLNDREHKKVLCITIHGDAAFAGQGITAETLNFADLPGFSVGGTVHIILNNLLGFTATPIALHSSRFASDVAKRLSIPIFHVNAEYPEDVVRTGQIAIDYRMAFASDVVIDLIGYRRYGHNEADDPTTTSPVLYKKIAEHPRLYQSYGKAIGIDAEKVKKLEEEIMSGFTAEQETATAMTKQPVFSTFPDYWTPFHGGRYDRSEEVDTFLAKEHITKLTMRLTTVPESFGIHPKVKKVLEDRFSMGQGNKPIDFGMAEALAFASLLWEGTPVRIVGQDSRRGTFNHRQAVLVDTNTEEQYIPLRNLRPEQAHFDVYDSMLSEAAAVGFEYGFSRDYPEALICWEAQFGDFANGAQIIIDQFFAAGEDKWQLLSGLVLLLPHGYEGQGPEHSSARIERFLQLAARDNIQICQPSTAAQYFHLLRRQVLRKWRKPLVVFTPKSMLRAAPASSSLKEFTDGNFYSAILDEPQYDGAERVLFCSGKIVHDLRTERKKRNDFTTAIVPVEQLYPFPEEELAAILRRYVRVKDIIWVQEEAANMGALSFMRPQLEILAGGKPVRSVKRSPCASPATGSYKAHDIEQKSLIQQAFVTYQGSPHENGRVLERTELTPETEVELHFHE